MRTSNLQPGPRQGPMALTMLLFLLLSTALSFSPSSQAVCSAQPQAQSTNNHNPQPSNNPHKKLLRHKYKHSTTITTTPLFSTATAAAPSLTSSHNRNAVLEWASKLVPQPQRHKRRQQQQQQQQQQEKRLSHEHAEYQRRKEEWANRYTHLDSLRDTFGANRNQIWGDLDAATARRLYKTLLPSALLELVQLGVTPQDLAPLAYQARVAAKLYARERCQVPARVGAQLFDGFRQWKRYGKFQTAGMSYDQVWEKYHQVIMDDCESSDGDCAGLTEQDVTAKICLKILERSCSTNEHVDRWVLPPDYDDHDVQDLQHITQTLEMDVRKLLLPSHHEQGQQAILPQSQQETTKAVSIQRYKLLKMVARARKRRRVALALGNPYYRIGHKATRAATAAQCPPNVIQEEEQQQVMATNNKSRKKSWRKSRRTKE